ncbi:MAG: indolepyruvate ferredoxin oxidoreductase subunit alpha, partial [Bacillota bacterium]|nr:indolepyruvate ferredoxin oxidoreductase subunit alpha [Bacillota bacterium]
MSKKLLMGNEAIAFGAIKAGVNVVSGYPGTPSTEVLETIAKNNPGDIYVEWSVNEKVAMEVAAGAAYAGSRTLVTMKQVGLNVASDPLMSLSYIGVKGGMVVLVADDPGPFSSQTEQDTRHYAKFANLPVFDPSSPEEAYEMIQSAFELSEKVKKPVFLRPTTRICHSCSTIDLSEERLIHKADGFVKDISWVIFPALSYKKHVQIEELQETLSTLFDDVSYNSINGTGKKGIAASGVAYAYIKEVLTKMNKEIKLFKVGTPYPLPKKSALKFMEGLDEVLVLEELDPVIEEGLLELCAVNKLNTVIKGKKTGNLPCAGEYSFELVKSAFLKFINEEEKDCASSVKAPQLPVRPPVLCAGCPHRASFYAVKNALKGQKAVFSGDIGCYTLGNAKPLDMVDTCLCMGAGITIAQGLQRSEPDVKHLAFIGDSTFFHTGIPGVINAVYNNTDITVIILDNSTTAMTGHQPHPGTGKTMMGS